MGSSGSGVVNSSALGENAIAFNFGLPSEPVKHVPGNAVSNGVTTPIVRTGFSAQKCKILG